MVFIAILGILDIIFGAALAASTMTSVTGNGWIFLFGILAILKGIYSVVTAAGAGFYLDVLGWLDLVVGLLLLLANWGIVFPFFLYIGILLILKGIYSFFVGMVGSDQ
ncbi:MAG: hypothetical protein DRO99_03410 [Candidatus Aenigmatarchaeota archaeon]|nr:MAG: hypothetical protein DRO99_03410 [Candidatus Aenigmarchaeota archaeon]